MAASGESIVGAAIGGDVISGVNSVPCGDGVGHIVSGTIQDVVGRTAVTVTRTRGRERTTAARARNKAIC